MIHITDKKKCTGCSACAQACTHRAISMEADKTGFLYPIIRKELCVECGACDKVCPTLIDTKSREPQHVYALQHRDSELRNNSSSGGAFTIIAKMVLRNGGVVYGASFDENWNVVHTAIHSESELSRLRGSKYVQSVIGETFVEAKKHLLKGIPVLFSGTPCQIAGLNRYLVKKYDNLITLDFVCHGVPSPRIWTDYLNEEINRHKAVAGKSTVLSSLNSIPSIEGVNFRDKSKGWKKYRFVLELAEASADGKKSSVFFSTDVWEHPYMLLFLKNYILRPSCHNCHFRCGRSGAMLTLGDFWCIERFLPAFSDDKGTSLVLIYNYEVNSDIASTLVSEAKCVESSYEHACFGNLALTQDCPVNKLSKLFYVLHDKLGFDLRHSLNLCEFLRSMWRPVGLILFKLKQLWQR